MIEDFRPDLYWQRSSRLDGLTFAAARRTGVPTGKRPRLPDGLKTIRAVPGSLIAAPAIQLDCDRRRRVLRRAREPARPGSR